MVSHRGVMTPIKRAGAPPSRAKHARPMKWIFLFAFVLLVGLSLVAWSIAPKPVEDGKVVLTLVSDPNPARDEQVALFNRLNPQYHLRLDPSNGGTEKIIVQSMGGVGPDLFHAYDAFQLSTFVKAGIAWDITDELPALGIARADLWPANDANYIVDGRVYGHPTNIVADALWFDKTVFDAEGVPYPRGPWTWDEFVAYAKQLVRRDADGRITRYGVLIDRYKWREFVLQFGGSIYSADGTRCIVDSAEAVNGIRCLYDLMYVHRVMPRPVDEAAMVSSGGWGSGGALKFFAAGRAPIALGGRWWLCLPEIRDSTTLKLGVAEGPHGTRRVWLGYGKGTLINRSSPNRQAALAYLAFQHGQAYNDLINRQADGLAPVQKYCFTEQYLHDPEHPREDFNAVFTDVMRFAVSEPTSPFINGSTAMRLITEQLDMVWENRKTPAEAMQRAAAAVNAQIAKNLERDPQLKDRFQHALVATGAGE